MLSIIDCKERYSELSRPLTDTILRIDRTMIRAPASDHCWRSGRMSRARKIAQLAEPGDCHADTPAAANEINDSACPGCAHVPRVDLVQEMKRIIRNPRSGPQADGEAIALDVMPSPQHSPEDRDHDHDWHGNARRDLQGPAIFVPPLCLKMLRKNSPNPRSKPRPRRRLHQC